MTVVDFAALGWETPITCPPDVEPHRAWAHEDAVLQCWGEGTQVLEMNGIPVVMHPVFPSDSACFFFRSYTWDGGPPPVYLLVHQGLYVSNRLLHEIAALNADVFETHNAMPSAIMVGSETAYALIGIHMSPKVWSDPEQ